MRVLVVSNLDSAQPFGQFTRPFHLGRGLARQGGVEVGNVGVDCARVDFGPSWSTGPADLRRLIGAVRAARRTFRPDLVYAHQNLPAVAALAGSDGVPVVADFHSLPSVEWRTVARTAPPRERPANAARAVKAAAAERLAARRSRGIVAAGAELADDLRAVHHPPVTPAVVVNGVADDILRAPVGPVPAPLARPGPHAVATIPAAASPANRTALAFLRDVTVELRAALPGAEVHIFGSTTGPDADGLHYHGFQPDLVPWMDHADACVLPYPPSAALCGGPRNKLLEGLARARTIVTTREGTRGLAESAGWEGVIVAPDEVAGFAAALAGGLASDAPRLDAVRPDVHRRLGWETLALELREVLGRVAAGR